MKTIKVMFLSWHFATPKVFLDTLLKMTPNYSGKWKNVEATLKMEEADFIIIMDGYREKIPTERALYFGQHPQYASPSYKDFKYTPCLKAFPLSDYLNPGEWWIKHSYDELMALQPPKKTKKMICIMTYQTSYSVYLQRIYFMRKFVQKYSDFEMFGRPEKKYRTDSAFNKVYKGALGNNIFDAYKGEHIIGKERLIDYRYSLDFDQGKTKNYFSERFYDAMLLWAMPIYFGSSNVHKFVPENSFRYVDIDNLDGSEIDKVIKIINSDFREKNLEAMKEARYLLLNKWQTFPYIHHIVNNIGDYVK